MISHLGRPKGEPDPKLAMDPVAERLEELLGAPVLKLGAAAGPEVEDRRWTTGTARASSSSRTPASIPARLRTTPSSPNSSPL